MGCLGVMRSVHVRAPLAILLLLGGLLALSGAATATTPIGDICHGLYRSYSGDAEFTDPFFLAWYATIVAENVVYFGGQTVVGALDAAEGYLPPRESVDAPLNEPNVPGDHEEICIDWVNVCGPVYMVLERV